MTFQYNHFFENVVETLNLTIIAINLLEQVAARWRPEGARKPDILDAPVFYPTEEVSVVALLSVLLKFHNVSLSL